MKKEEPYYPRSSELQYAWAAAGAMLDADKKFQKNSKLKTVEISIPAYTVTDTTSMYEDGQQGLNRSSDIYDTQVPAQEVTVTKTDVNQFKTRYGRHLS